MRNNLYVQTRILHFLGFVFHVLAAKTLNSLKCRSPLEALVIKFNEFLVPLSFAASDVMSDGVTIIAGSDIDGRVYKSVDEGITWTEVWKASGTLVRCVFIDSRDYIFVSAMGSSALYRSTGGGATFEKALSLPSGTSPDRTCIWGMIEDDTGNLYAGNYDTYHAIIYKSVDEGHSWFKVYDDPSQRHIHQVVMNPESGWIYATDGDNPSDGGVLRSKDQGSTWTRIVKMGVQFVAITFRRKDVFLGADAMGRRDGIYKFTDDGEDFFIPKRVLQARSSFFWGRTTPDGIIVFGGVCDKTQIGWPAKLKAFHRSLSSTCAVWASNDGGAHWTESLNRGVLGHDKGFRFASHKFSKSNYLFLYDESEVNGIKIRISKET